MFYKLENRGESIHADLNSIERKIWCNRQPEDPKKEEDGKLYIINNSKYCKLLLQCKIYCASVQCYDSQHKGRKLGLESYPVL